MSTLKFILLFTIFPGFIFSSCVGLIAGWIDRKVTARIQWRVGPPWYQNFVDAAKLLFYKETLIPKGAMPIVFLGMPALGLAAATLASTIILLVFGSPRSGFVGDIIVIVYLLMIPSISIIFGALSSQNPLASIGASREIKLFLSYELPFIFALVVPIIKANSIKLGQIISVQASTGPFIESISGALSFIAIILSIQAKMGLPPFDMPEAETEIMAGAYIEYSGKPLGFLKLTKAVMLCALPVFIVSLYFGGIVFDLEGITASVLQYLLIITIMVLVKNTNPRVRIDQALRFFWVIVTSIAITAAVLAYAGF